MTEKNTNPQADEQQPGTGTAQPETAPAEQPVETPADADSGGNAIPEE